MFITCCCEHTADKKTLKGGGLFVSESEVQSIMERTPGGRIGGAHGSEGVRQKQRKGTTVRLLLSPGPAWSVLDFSPWSATTRSTLILPCRQSSLETPHRHLKKILLYFLLICMLSLCMYSSCEHVSTCLRRSQIPETRVAGCCEVPGLDERNQAPVLRENSKHS